MDPSSIIETQPTFSSPTQFHQNSGQQISSAQDLSATMDSSTMGSVQNTAFDSPFIDPNDPSLFNFNISDLNFGNHYGALEFGMLGHISSGAVNTPDLDLMNSMGQHNSISYDSQPGFQTTFGYDNQLQSWGMFQDIDERRPIIHGLLRKFIDGIHQKASGAINAQLRSDIYFVKGICEEWNDGLAHYGTKLDLMGKRNSTV